MTIIFWITPTTLAKLGSKAVEFIPGLGPGLKFTKQAEKITKLTDPVSYLTRTVGMLFNYCFGKTGAVSVECILWVSLSVAGGITCNPLLITAGTEFGNMILDEFIN